MEREKYIKVMLDQHLLNTKNYTQLISNEATAMHEDFAFELTEILKFEHRNDLSLQEQKFFERSYQTMNRIPQLYGNPKVHKNWTTQVPFRPVNSQCGSLSAAASKYVDYYLKKLLPFVPGYIKNSYKVILRLKNINCCNGTTRVFTSDAIAMYPNILNDEDINACEKFFDLFAKECKSFFPSVLNS